MLPLADAAMLILLFRLFTMPPCRLFCRCRCFRYATTLPHYCLIFFFFSPCCHHAAADDAMPRDDAIRHIAATLLFSLAAFMPLLIRFMLRRFTPFFDVC